MHQPDAPDDTIDPAAVNRSLAVLWAPAARNSDSGPALESGPSNGSKSNTGLSCSYCGTSNSTARAPVTLGPPFDEQKKWNRTGRVSVPVLAVPSNTMSGGPRSCAFAAAMTLAIATRIRAHHLTIRYHPRSDALGQFHLRVQLRPQQRGISGNVEPQHDPDHCADRSVSRVEIRQFRHVQ